MTLTKCSDCGVDVSDKTVICPKCGRPLKSMISTDGELLPEIGHSSKNKSDSGGESSRNSVDHASCVKKSVGVIALVLAIVFTGALVIQQVGNQQEQQSGESVESSSVAASDKGPAIGKWKLIRQSTDGGYTIVNAPLEEADSYVVVNESGSTIFYLQGKGYSGTWAYDSFSKTYTMTYGNRVYKGMYIEPEDFGMPVGPNESVSDRKTVETIINGYGGVELFAMIGTGEMRNYLNYFTK